MLDALKFAFEILIVGALTLPWLVIVIQLLAPDRALSMSSYLSFLPEGTQSAVSIVLLVAFGYVAGSAVSRISMDLFNDEMFGVVPSEDSIRQSVYVDEYCKNHIIASYKSLPYDSSPSSLQQAKLKLAFCDEIAPASVLPAASAQSPSDLAETVAEDKNEAIREMFSLQEGELLLLGQDKVDRLKQYFDQITVLRGAAANALMLFVVCVFGTCVNLKVHWKASPARFLAFIPSVAVLAFGNYSLVTHTHGVLHGLARLYADPPLAESVVILVGCLGFFMTLTAKEAVHYHKAGLLALVVFIVCFEGWWWTEVMYDLHVVHSQTELHSHATETPAPGPAPSLTLPGEP